VKSYRTRLAAVVALLMALAIPGAAFAASSQSSAMTLTISSVISVSGVPASLDFGSPLAGTNANAPQFTVTYSSNGSATFTSSVTDLTASGGGLIAKANVSQSLASGSYAAADGATIASFGAAGGSSSKTVDVRVAVPAAQQAGAYTGTYTIAGS
jgi:hypothetical protein